MDRLYTPWRHKYVTSNKKKPEGCVFCAMLTTDPEHDRQNHLIYRGQSTFTIMNIYPYNTGHLMILPNSHVPSLTDMTHEAQVEMITLTSYFTELLAVVMNPHGFNIGINLGQAAGAGVADHIHTHIVPRWSGDSNFMTTVGDVRVLPETLDDTFDKIVEWLQQHPPSK